jgi:drug/metabolite transporter (DMT)-like permease
MHSLRHIFYFVSLGLFWGISPSLYKYWGEVGVPASHVIGFSGFGIAVAMVFVARWWERTAGWTVPVIRYSLICAVLMNVPFAWSLTLARHVPAPELALVFSISPLINFIVAALFGNDVLTPRRLLGVLFGFAASTVLVLTREGMVSGEVSWWLLAAFLNPFFWAAYNWYAQHYWPKGGSTLGIGAAESLWSGVLALPFMLALAPPWATQYSGALASWSIAAATVMWVAERISFFTLIREKGAAYTSQAVYLSSPAAVLIAMAFFGGGSDIWLWLSLALVMLYLNNSGSAIRQESIQPSS